MNDGYLQSRGSQAWSTAQDSESCPAEVREFKSRPLHFYHFTGEKHRFNNELYTTVKKRDLNLESKSRLLHLKTLCSKNMFFKRGIATKSKAEEYD
jgi:hypothetical protein